jgi:TRAP-type C4-dicarboxylate transport system permease small subunit
MKILKHIAALLQKALNTLSITLMFAMVVIMFSQVMLRTFAGSSIIWSEEALRFMFIWLVFLGVAAAIYSNDLSRFELLQEKLPPLGQKILSTLIHLFSGAILYIAAIGAMPLIRRQMNQLATALPIKMGVVDLVIPVSASIGIFYLLLHLITMWTERPGKTEG